VPFAGFGTLVAISLLLFGITYLILGVISEYIGLIYEEVKARPNFIVSDISSQGESGIDNGNN
jgi:dolichol-phosphate mannosyltransferase